MDSWRRRLAQGLLAIPFSTVPVGRTWAQPAYPDRPIRLVVPFAPGSSTDIAARAYAGVMGSVIRGANFVIDNRPGASGTLGAAVVARAPADGYTILYSAATPIVIAPHLYSELPYNVAREFAPIAVTISVPLFAVVSGASPIRSIGDLSAHLRSNPSTSAYGSNGIGTSGHFAAKAIANEMGVPDLVHVPYRQGAQAVMADLVGGRLTFAVDVWSVVGPLVKAGRLRAIASTDSRRLSAAPSVPTLSEVFRKDVEIVTWNGLWAPANTPQAVIELVHRAADAARQDKALVENFESQGTPIMAPMGLAETREFIEREGRRWKSLIDSTGIRL